MSSRSPSNRWQTATGAELAARVLDRLVGGDSLDGLPLDRQDGRVDLRGLIVPTPESLGAGSLREEGGDEEPPGLEMRWLGGLIEFRGVTLADLDLSGAQLDHLRFFDSSLRNCLFDKAKCRDWRGWNLAVDECSFRGSVLRGSALGTWHEGKGNHYSAVNFSQSDLREIVCQGASFIDCDFTKIRLENIHFGACDFIRCKFEGLIDSVRFSADPMVGVEKTEPGRMQDVDFSAATLRWTEFNELPLDRVTLPPDNDEHVVVHHYPCVVRHVINRLDDDVRPETRRLRARMRAESRQLDESRDIGLWHRDELGETPEQQYFARELLHETEQECSASENRTGPS